MPAPIGNKYALGNNGGRPAHYETTDDLIKSVDGYFTYIQGDFHLDKKEVYNEQSDTTEEHEFKVWDRDPEPATVTGLSLYLGFCSRSSFDDYAKRSEEFSYIIKKSKMLVEHEYEKKLNHDKPTGAIFALKNMGWADRSELDVTSKGAQIAVPSVTLPDGTELEL